jgi:hypothetical protein
VIGEPDSVALLAVHESGRMRGIVRRADGLWELAPELPRAGGARRQDGGGGGGGGCGETLTLSNQTVTTTQTFETCGTLRAGNGFTVAWPGNVTLRGATVVLQDGFSVAPGARLRVESQ